MATDYSLPLRGRWHGLSVTEGENTVVRTFVANRVGLVEDSINAMICEERIGYKTFANIHGSELEFDATNGVTVKGWGSVVGIGETTKNGLTYGAFFETGEGDYNTFAKQREGYICGDGDVEYEGGGMLVRKDHVNGTYMEGSLRIGHMNNRVSNAVVDSKNQLRGFDVGGTYYGAHVGIGKMILRGDKERLDFYSKFLYSHIDGARFMIDGDTFSLDNVDSQRLRVGLRYHKQESDKLRIYCGAAYEYEFDANAKNHVLDYTFSSPDLGGSTVIGEVGYHYNADDKWCFDMSLRGYDGQREGFGGSVQVNYMF